ncbi:MAG TPA: hypothetical protein VHW04_23055 [Solirubrobacteraceae bacterium]|jgi:hypothetical protein|nr:hypothetical protein [Solirubrobacteraceae bacterium]
MSIDRELTSIVLGDTLSKSERSLVCDERAQPVLDAVIAVVCVIVGGR